MALVLKKGQSINLRKESPKLTTVNIGLSWTEKPGITSDLDLSVILLGSDDKMWAEDSIVFYHKLLSADGAIRHTGDDRSGGSDDSEEEQDNEVVVVDLAKVAANTQSILVVATTYSDGEPIHFGRISNAMVRLVDAMSEKELMRFDLSEDMSGVTSMEMAKLTRTDAGWEFKALGNSLGTDAVGLQPVIDRYTRQ